MKRKKTLKERTESVKKRAKAWWDENKEFAILASISIATAGLTAIIGERTGRKRGNQECIQWVIDKCGEDPMTIWEYDNDGNNVRLDAIATERFYDAFQHPEKTKWYEDGSFDYVDKLEKGD